MDINFHLTRSVAGEYYLDTWKTGLQTWQAYLLPLTSRSFAHEKLHAVAGCINISFTLTVMPCGGEEINYFFDILLVKRLVELCVIYVEV